jgi:hypothetical protein
MRKLAVFLAGVALAVSAIAATSAGPAAAAATSDVEQLGTLVLYQNPDFTGPSHTINYLECGSNVLVPGLPVVGSFDNRPLVGCQANLVGPAGTFTLCAGRGVVPVAFRQNPAVRIQPGLTPPCGLSG